jgi:anti-sigma B factor antagonist
MKRVIPPAAEIDMATAPQLGTAVLDSLARGDRQVVVDLTGVRLIDSAGIGVLLSLQRRAHACGGEIVLANASEHVRRVFALTGVERALNVSSA